MNSETRRPVHDIEADVFALDRDDRSLLVAEAKARREASEDGVSRFLTAFETSDFPYGMFADLETITIFARPRSPICSLRTADVLSHYEPEFTAKRIFPDYFEALIEACLRDFAFHWKSERPPGADRLEAIGLAQRLVGGMTYRG